MATNKKLSEWSTAGLIAAFLAIQLICPVFGELESIF
jgi:hypothetical protein